jgi:succinate dehydrogenase/fumarate reductase cytochrome b subunit
LYVFMWSEYLISVHAALIDRHLGMKRCSCMHALVVCVIASVFLFLEMYVFLFNFAYKVKLATLDWNHTLKTTLFHLRESCFLLLRAFNQEEYI